jgi:hypothetical protein
MSTALHQAKGQLNGKNDVIFSATGDIYSLSAGLLGSLLK